MKIRIFVVSLSDATAKRAAIAAQFGGAELAFEFFDAVDGHQVPPTFEPLVDRSFKRYQRRTGIGLKMSGGEVGCALSHALLYKKMVEEGISEAIIMEDDVTLRPEFMELLKGRTLFDSPFDLVMLHHGVVAVNRWSGSPFGSSSTAYRPLETPKGTVAYYLRLSASQRLLAKAFPVSDVADWPAPVHRWKGTVCLHPAVIGHAPYHQHPPTSITAERRRNRESWRAQAPSRRLSALRRCLSLLVFPCLLWPETYGDVGSLTCFLERMKTRALIWLFGVRLPEG